jgi:hypothetical protein
MITLVTILAVALLAAGPVHAERTNTLENTNEVAVTLLWSGAFAGLLYAAHEDEPESD